MTTYNDNDVKRKHHIENFLWEMKHSGIKYNADIDYLVEKTVIGNDGHLRIYFIPYLMMPTGGESRVFMYFRDIFNLKESKAKEMLWGTLIFRARQTSNTEASIYNAFKDLQSAFNDYGKKYGFNGNLISVNPCHITRNEDGVYLGNGHWGEEHEIISDKFIGTNCVKVAKSIYYIFDGTDWVLMSDEYKNKKLRLNIGDEGTIKKSIQSFHRQIKSINSYDGSIKAPVNVYFYVKKVNKKNGKTVINFIPQIMIPSGGKENVIEPFKEILGIKSVDYDDWILSTDILHIDKYTEEENIYYTFKKMLEYMNYYARKVGFKRQLFNETPGCIDRTGKLLYWGENNWGMEKEKNVWYLFDGTEWIKTSDIEGK